MEAVAWLTGWLASNCQESADEPVLFPVTLFLAHVRRAHIARNALQCSKIGHISSGDSGLMRILLLTHTLNSRIQQLFVELKKRECEVAVLQAGAAVDTDNSWVSVEFPLCDTTRFTLNRTEKKRNSFTGS